MPYTFPYTYTNTYTYTYVYVYVYMRAAGAGRGPVPPVVQEGPQPVHEDVDEQLHGEGDGEEDVELAVQLAEAGFRAVGEGQVLLVLRVEDADEEILGGRAGAWVGRGGEGRGGNERSCQCESIRGRALPV